MAAFTPTSGLPEHEHPPEDEDCEFTAIEGGASQKPVGAAIKEVCDFWRALVSRAGTRPMVRVSILLLAAGLSEGLTISLLVPLLRAIDPASGVKSSSSWLDRLFGSLNLRPTLAIALIMFVGVAFFRAIIARYAEVAMTRLRLDLIRDIRVQLYAAIAHANWLLLRRIRRADLQAALTAEVDRLGEATDFALQMPSRAVMITIHLVIAALIAPILTFCAVGTGLFIAWLVHSHLGKSLGLGVRLSNAYRELHRQVSEFLAGLKITKSLGSEERHIGAFNNAVEEIDFQLLAYTRSAAKAKFLQNIAGILVVGAFVWTSVVIARLPIPEVLVLALIFYRLLPLIQSLQQALQQVLYTAPAAQRVFQLTRECQAEREVAGSTGWTHRLTQDLVVLNLSYRHAPNEQKILCGLAFSLRAGTLTVLAGESGAGKSTLLELLAGLLRQDEGEILIDGKVLGPGELLKWRCSVGYLTQEPFLFHDTIRANLLIADPRADDSAIARALVGASAAELVQRLPQRLETVVGERGTRMSGGERQRLALARALLRRPALLILDEPTSALDQQNERAVLEAIEGLKGHTTIVLVTHRPDRVLAADQVLTLQDGKLFAAPAQAGPHERVGKGPRIHSGGLDLSN